MSSTPRLTRSAAQPGDSGRRRAAARGVYEGGPTALAAKIGLYSALTATAVIAVYPFWWMIVASTRTTSTILTLPPPFWPGGALATNYHQLLEALPYWRDLLNTVLIGLVYSALAVFFCSLAGYAFAKFRFVGRDKLFALTLGTLMIPPVLGVIPSYMLMRTFGWLDTWYPLIIPSAANAFGIFWMRQYISSAVPDELIDAARIDGAREFRIYWNVVCPVILPGLSALAVFSFLQKWGEFLWPLLILKDPNKYTLPVAIASLTTKTEENLGVLILAATVAILPVLMVFLLASRKFIDGLTLGAVKGGG